MLWFSGAVGFLIVKNYIRHKLQTCANIGAAESLWAKEVNVETSGSSKVNVYADSALSGKVSEGAVLTYKGNPTYKNIDSQQGGKLVEPK